MTTLASARFVADPGEGIIDGATTPARPAVRIDKGVPVPDTDWRYVGSHPKYPWRQLTVGDSFIFPPRASLRATQVAANGACGARKALHGEQYTTRTVEEDGQRVVRVWRVA